MLPTPHPLFSPSLDLCAWCVQIDSVLATQEGEKAIDEKKEQINKYLMPCEHFPGNIFIFSIIFCFENISLIAHPWLDLISLEKVVLRFKV